MFKKVINSLIKPTNSRLITRLVHAQNKLVDQSTNNEILEEIKAKKTNLILEPCQEDISHIAPYLRPTFNFAGYVNQSETLQQLVKLGVNLFKLERRPDVTGFILKLNFEQDIKKYITFLHDYGLKPEEIAVIFTKNPLILKEDLDNLQVRINYLKYKKFDDAMVLRILQNNPNWLSFSTQEIDEKLGFFQKSYHLSGNEVRQLTIKRPKLITYNRDHIKLNTFVIKEEMGFDEEQTKQILLDTPVLFMKNQQFILKTFEYIHRTMNIPLETIAQTSRILTCRESRVKERHLFLEKLGKAQYDPKKPNYIAVITLVSGTDSEFCTDVAGSSIQAYNTFLKSM